MGSKARIISILNHKGGTGKTTTTVNLGAGLVRTGKRVLLIDADPQANTTLWCDLVSPERTLFDALVEGTGLPIVPVLDRLHLAPSELNLAGIESELSGLPDGGFYRLGELLAPVQDQFDFILIDCPPSLGLLSINALTACNELLIPVQAQYLAVAGLDSLFEALERLRSDLSLNIRRTSVVLTQVARTVISRSVIDHIRSAYPAQTLNAVIRHGVALQDCSATHKDVFMFDSNSNGAVDYAALTSEILLQNG